MTLRNSQHNFTEKHRISPESQDKHLTLTRASMFCTNLGGSRSVSIVHSPPQLGQTPKKQHKTNKIINKTKEKNKKKKVFFFFTSLDMISSQTRKAANLQKTKGV